MRISRLVAVVIGAVLAAGSAVALPAPAAANGTGVASAAAAAKKPWLRHSDFNGDGFNDLAMGAPGGTVAGQAFAGYVSIVYGSQAGLDPAKRVVLSQDGPAVPGDPAASVRFGDSFAVGDFNSDTFADLAVGAPNDGGGGTQPGSVTVFFGSKAGLGRPARITGTYHLGRALTAADMDGNGRPEIIATETPNNFGQIYRITVAKGSFTPVKTAQSAVYGLYILTAGDVNGDGYDDLFAFFNQVGGSHSFAYFPGSKAGLKAEPKEIYTYDGGVDAAVGDLNRDGRADLVVGRAVRPFDNPTSGEVTVWYGTPTGLGAEPSLSLTQDTAEVPDTAEPYDQFGSAVAIGDITGDGNPELAIGAQYEDVGEVENAGAVTVLRGSAKGITTSGQWLTQGASGAPGTPQQNETFGWMLALRDYNGDKRADLAVTAIGENPAPERPFYGDGAVTVFPGTAAGATGAGGREFSGDSVGAGAASARFGWALGR